ncbi:hypothetical protein Adt_20786 [Abeliophyllum distichum]|uniref:Uncharacterized protein n=1 Tax=Abeliophyllum distichum TaxID=126358 RepID=A0ABD1SXI4_9LAMI
MVALSSLQTSLHSSANTHHIPFSSCKLTSPFLLYFRHLHGTPTRSQASKSNGIFAYMEEKNSISNFANKVIGSLPVVGLVARILSDEGGVGSDFIDFAEFRRRVGKKCSINDSRAFYEFKDRRGRAGDPLYVLLCCWLAAVGAGLLKSEEILEGVARLRISNDIEFEEQNFIAMMNEAREKRAKLRAPVPSIPMEVRAEKALEAIYFGQPQIESIINEKAKKVAEGTDEIKIPEPMPLSKEAVQMQMKDLQFLRQGDEKSGRGAKVDIGYRSNELIQIGQQLGGFRTTNGWIGCPSTIVDSDLYGNWRDAQCSNHGKCITVRRGRHNDGIGRLKTEDGGRSNSQGEAASYGDRQSNSR